MIEVEEKETGGRRSEGGGSFREEFAETAPIVLASWKTTAYKGNSMTRKLGENLTEMENTTSPGTEEDFKTQKANAKKDSISGQMWK